MRVFLDANVLFAAAHNPEGKAALLVDLARDGLVELCTCALAVEEARRNLEEKFPEGLAALDRLMGPVRLVPTRVQGPVPEVLPSKDRPILLSATGAGATHLVTGDIRHFGPLMGRPAKTGGILVCTVADFLATGGGTRRPSSR
jgi:predicted nucleic acid-binding protein